MTREETEDEENSDYHPCSFKSGRSLLGAGRLRRRRKQRNDDIADTHAHTDTHTHTYPYPHTDTYPHTNAGSNCPNFCQGI